MIIQAHKPPKKERNVSCPSSPVYCMQGHHDWHCRQVTQVLFLSHLWAEAILGPGVGRKGPAHMLEALPFSPGLCEPSGGPGTVCEEERGWTCHALPYSFLGASVVRFSEPFSSTNWCSIVKNLAALCSWFLGGRSLQVPGMSFVSHGGHLASYRMGTGQAEKPNGRL